MMAEEDNGQVKKSGSNLIIKTKFKLSLKDIYNKTRRGTSWQQHDLGLRLHLKHLHTIRVTWN